MLRQFFWKIGIFVYLQGFIIKIAADLAGEYSFNFVDQLVELFGARQLAIEFEIGAANGDIPVNDVGVLDDELV